MCKQEAWVMQR